jgi:succinate-semialdehyde dehydrogenase/glutarate-semialdehyde dehydrogenase
METAHVATAEVVGFETLSDLTAQITLCDGPHDSIAVHAPFTGKVLGTIPVARDTDVELAVQRARAAQPQWAARSFSDRAGIFLRF